MAAFLRESWLESNDLASVRTDLLGLGLLLKLSLSSMLSLVLALSRSRGGLAARALCGGLSL